MLLGFTGRVWTKAWSKFAVQAATDEARVQELTAEAMQLGPR